MTWPGWRRTVPGCRQVLAAFGRFDIHHPPQSFPTAGVCPVAGAAPAYRPGDMANSPSKRLIFLTVLLDLVGFGIVIPLLPTYAEDLGANYLTIGLLLATHSAVQFLVGPAVGALSDRIGRRPVLLVTVLGNTLAYLVLASCNSLPLLFLARALSGASAANISTASAYLSDISSRQNRAAAMGIIGAAFGLGFVLGPALAGIFAHPITDFGLGELTAGFNPSLPYYVAAGLSALNFVFIFTRLPESLPPERRAHPGSASLNPLARFSQLAQVTPAQRRLLLGYFLNIAAFAIMTTLFSLFCQNRLGFTEAQNARTFALIGLIGVVIQGGLLRRIEPKVGARKLILLGTAGLAVSLAILPWVQSVGLLLVAAVGIALSNSLSQPSLNTAASRLADERNQGLALGLMASAGSLGRVIGPALGGSLLRIAPGPASFGNAALGLSVGVMVLAFFVLRHLPAHADAPVTAVDDEVLGEVPED